ncbi:MAG: trigger factor [Gemmataceae bacterium]
MSEQENPNPTPPTEPTDETNTAVAEASAAEEGPGKLRQDVVISDTGPCKKHIKVTVNRDDIDSRVDEKVSKLVVEDHAMVAGFRPGKAPRKVVERRYHKDVMEQVRAEVLMASLEQIAEDHDIAPLSPPDIDPLKIDIPKTGPLIYEFDVEVRPQFDLPNYKGLKLKRPVMKFTEADVDREQRRILEPYGQIVPKGDNAKVDVGDFIVADLTSRLGGNVVNEAKEVQVRVDARLALKDGVAEDFGKTMAGAKVGDDRTVVIVLSDAVAEPNLRGAKVDATFHINDIKTLRLPELNEELLERFGVKTPEAFRELVRVVLDRRLEYTQRQSARQQVLQLINEASQWELPQDLLRRQARRTMQQRVMEMRNAGMTDEEILGRQRMLQQDVLKATAMTMKEQFVLHKIAEEEKLEVSDDDINDEIERIADRAGESPRRVRARLEREDMLEALAVELLERKALDLVLQNAEYEDVPVGAAEQDVPMATSEAQAVQGEVQDSTAPPPPEPAADSGEAK